MFVIPERFIEESGGDELATAGILHGALHELAHFWWRIAVTSDPSDWINEGLAEYSAFRLSGLMSGVDYQQILLYKYRADARSGSSDLAIAEPPQESKSRELNRYELTTLMFRRAAEQFGQAEVDGLLRFLHGAYVGNRTATTKNFLEAAKNEIGAGVSSFFRDCLVNPTNPVVMGE